jgi:TRAP-type C4-dicarboxylate transport system permease small subunit
MAFVIFAALSAQIISRYVFNAPIDSTDAIAEAALVWMTFIGAAMVYRERGHIAVGLIEATTPPVIQKAVRIIIHLVVIAVLAYVLTQVGKLQPLMARVQFGTVPHSPYTSKFVFVLLPFALGAGLTIIFALEAIWRDLTGQAPVQTEVQEII